MKNEKHLFIIWEKARKHTNKIFEVIEEKFVILDVYEITWNNENFEKNLRKFYGITLSNPSKKIKQIGTGPFLLVIVEDKNPKYGRRKTSMGKQLVNMNMYEKKRELRKLIEGEFPIHGSIHEKETNHNLALLLEKNLDIIVNHKKKWDGKNIKIKKDIVGINGWDNFEQLFFTLNNTTNYVILRNYENILKNEIDEKKEDIDILTDDQFQMPYILGKKLTQEKNKDFPFVNINNKFIKFDLKYVGDIYLDEKWSKEILLRKKIISKLIFIPSNEDYFYTLLHHIVVQNIHLNDKYKKILILLNTEIKIPEFQLKCSDKKYLQEILDEFMNKKGYKYTNSLSYKFLHNEPLRLMKVALKVAKSDGMYEVIRAAKGKIKRKLK